jgi:hypothetical protein
MPPFWRLSRAVLPSGHRAVEGGRCGGANQDKSVVCARSAGAQGTEGGQIRAQGRDMMSFFMRGEGGGKGKGGHEHSLEPKALCLLAASGLLLPLADELWLGEGKKKAGRGRGGGAF